MHWRILCLDGGRSAVGDAGAEVEVKTCSWTPGRARAPDHIASEVRDANATGSAPRNRQGLVRFVRQVDLGNVLRNFSRLGATQIREHDHSQLIIHIAVDSGFESLP